MAPKRAKKNASTSSNDSISTSQAPTTVVPTKPNDGARTPEQTQTRPAIANLTQAQKQALMDNLQLEITERARKLRAQYAVQAQALRSRLEMRVNRIPQGLRKRKIQDLIDEHAERARPHPTAPVSVLQDEVGQGIEQADFGGGKQTLKRNSNHLDADEDQENMASEANKDLANPKKRTKTTTTTTTANTKATRTVSRKDAPSAVLSPKSHNSRTLPRSPFKTASSQQKVSTTTRPTSPTKPAPAAATATTKAPARAPTRQTKRKGVAASDQENDGRSSEGSNTSASTTIVSKIVNKAKATAAGRRAAATKTTTAAAAKRAAAVQKKENVAPVSTAAGGRTLRKRG